MCWNDAIPTGAAAAVPGDAGAALKTKSCGSHFGENGDDDDATINYDDDDVLTTTMMTNMAMTTMTTTGTTTMMTIAIH